MQTISKVSWEKIDRSPTPHLEKALKATLKTSVSKSDAHKLIRRLSAAALDEAGPAIPANKEENEPQVSPAARAGAPATDD